MALPFSGSKARRRDQVIGLDLGSHSAKAVYLQRKGQGLILQAYAVEERESPIVEESTAAQLPERLSRLLNSLGAKHKQVVMAISASESVLRPAEMPMVPVSDMRTMLKYNTKSYLQQDLPDSTFDCFVLPFRPANDRKDGSSTQKARVLVGATRNALVEEKLSLLKAAGLHVEGLVPELICPANAFEVAEPELFARESVALVDLGFNHSSICLLLEGELVLNRVVGVGGNKITTGLAEVLGTSYTEAEGIKLGLPHEVDSTLVPIIAPLARELRASIDFFEHQHDRTVGKVFVSGAGARSPYFLGVLQSELMVPCSPWSPVGAVTPSLSAQQTAALDQSAVLLCTAVGAALSVI